MARRPQRSLRHEYELYLEEEIENYKESVPRSVLLSIGDEAVRNLATHAQTALTELLLLEEVDRIIAKRLRMPSYATWRRRRLKLLVELRRPDHWEVQADDALIGAAHASPAGRVLVADEESSALHFAANGCAVTALATHEEVVRRVIAAATQIGLSERIRGEIASLASWTPDAPLSAVVLAAHLLADLPADTRADTIARLQVATTPGGVHLFRDVPRDGAQLPLAELKRRYRDWDVLIAPMQGASNTFLARKHAS